MVSRWQLARPDPAESSPKKPEKQQQSRKAA